MQPPARLYVISGRLKTLYPNGVDVDVGELVVEPAALVHRQEQPTKTRAHAEPKAELPNVSEEKYSTGFGLAAIAILTAPSAESTGRICKTVVYSEGMRL